MIDVTLITDPDTEGAIDRLVHALDGAPAERLAVQVRAPDARRGALAERLAAVTSVRGVRLLINGDLALALRLGAGLHLPERGPSVDEARARGVSLVGASVHDGAGVARRAGASFVLLAPVFDVPNKGPALGADGLARIASGAPMPVLALGGVDSPERAAEAIRAGAAGIGVRRGIAVARDPARLVQSLCAAIDEARAELAAKSVGERAVAGKLVLR